LCAPQTILCSIEELLVRTRVRLRVLVEQRREFTQLLGEVVESFLALVRSRLSGVGQPLALVGEQLALVGQPFALIGDLFPLVGQMFARFGFSVALHPLAAIACRGIRHNPAPY
jgi:hypothetical protein